MVPTLVGLAGVGLGLWLVGYLLVVDLAPRDFEPGVVRAALGLLMGVAFAALFGVVVAYAASGSRWFVPAVSLCVPAALVILVAAGLYRPQTRAVIKQDGSALVRTVAGRSLFSSAGRWASFVALLALAAILWTHRAHTRQSVQISASRQGTIGRIVIRSTSRVPQQFVLHISSNATTRSVTVRTRTIDEETGSKTFRVSLPGVLTVTLRPTRPGPALKKTLRVTVPPAAHVKRVAGSH